MKKYKIIIQPEAKLDINSALDYYKTVANTKVAKSLNFEIKSAIKTLKLNPFFEVRSNNYRAINLKKFPYLLFYQLVESANTIFILALFQAYQDTEKYPK